MVTDMYLSKMTILFQMDHLEPVAEIIKSQVYRVPIELPKIVILQSKANSKCLSTITERDMTVKA